MVFLVLHTFNGTKGFGRQTQGCPESSQEAVLCRLVGGPEPQDGVTVAHQVRHEQGVELRVVKIVWDRWASVLARVVHPLQPVIWKVLAEGVMGEGGMEGGERKEREE